MPSFKFRSHQKELLDQRSIPFEDIKANMQELDRINSRLGGHTITLEGFKSFLQKNSAAKKMSILEIGCGGGDNLRAIKIWCKEKAIAVDLAGVDINPECIAFARSQKNNEGIEFICSDYRQLVLETRPTIIFSSLFCHHFTNDELIEMMKWKCENSQLGFFINDLHRHWLAWTSISIITRLFSKSYLVENDAPISVLRGFQRHDWVKIFAEAGIQNYSVKWKWAFRWLIRSEKINSRKPAIKTWPPHENV